MGAITQVSFGDFREFASLRKELHNLQVALEFYQKTTGHFGLDDLKVWHQTDKIRHYYPA